MASCFAALVQPSIWNNLDKLVQHKEILFEETTRWQDSALYLFYFSLCF